MKQKQQPLIRQQEAKEKSLEEEEDSKYETCIHLLKPDWELLSQVFTMSYECAHNALLT